MAIFGPFIALDPTQSPMLAKGAAGKAYATDDTGLVTPLAMTDLSGLPISDAVADGNGLVQGINVDGETEVIWVSGSYRVPVRSYDGVLAQATTAATNADSSAQSANAAATAAEQNRVPAGGTSGQVLAKITNADNDVGWIAQTGGGGGSGITVLGADDPVPPGTAAMSPIFRLEGDIPTPSEVNMLTGTGNVTFNYGSLTTSITLAAPANTAVGDVLMAVAWAQASVAPFDWSQTAGWTSQFEATSGRRLMIATYPIPDAAAVTAATTGTHTFAVPTDASNTRNGAMIFRLTGANLTTPVVGVSVYAEGSPTGKTFPSLTASAPALADLLIWTAQRSSGVTEPTITHPAGLITMNKYEALNTAEPPAGSFGVAELYRTTGTSIPERVETYAPTWSAGVSGLHIALAGA
jgi:hypothetical protein